MAALLNTDGKTITPVNANPANHGLKIDDNTTGSDNGNNNGNAAIDENSKSSLYALSSDGLGSRINLYSTSDGKLLIQST